MTNDEHVVEALYGMIRALEKLTAMVEDVVRKLDSTNVVLEEIADAVQEKNENAE